MTEVLLFAAACFAVLMASASAFHILVRLGPVGKRICNAAAAAPGLDLVVFYFTTAPTIAAIVLWWVGAGEKTFLRLTLLIVAGLVSQAATLMGWSRIHEALHPGIRKGPRISGTLNRRVGPFRNAAAVWWTALAVPIFNLVRIAEIALYPPLIWLVRFPKYDMNEWVNVSRHKFSGLVGYDLIWCLYCDWMTGVWSLGSEMLRNVESFWCPIRFSSPEKCDNCHHDFPDVNGEWVPADKSIGDVTKVLEAKYPGPGGVNAWFGHSTRLTVKGKPLD